MGFKSVVYSELSLLLLKLSFPDIFYDSSLDRPLIRPAAPISYSYGSCKIFKMRSSVLELLLNMNGRGTL